MSDRESWLLDFASDGGISGFARLELRRDESVAWFWTYLIGPEIDGLVVVRDHDVPLPRARLELRADGLWTEFSCETPHEHWTFGLEAFGVRLDAPDDALAGEIGERLPVGFDLEWEVAGSGDGSVRHEGVVHGEILLSRSRYEIDTQGTFTHIEGETKWPSLTESCGGQRVGHVLIPFVEGAVLERTLCRDERGPRWLTTAVRDFA
jgi:hypothetical protein